MFSEDSINIHLTNYYNFVLKKFKLRFKFFDTITIYLLKAFFISFIK